MYINEMTGLFLKNNKRYILFKEDMFLRHRTDNLDLINNKFLWLRLHKILQIITIATL